MHSPQFDPQPSGQIPAAQDPSARDLFDAPAEPAPLKDESILRITVEKASPQTLARELGAVLMDGIRRDGKLLKLDGNPKAKNRALVLLYAICYEFGEIESSNGGLVSLVVRTHLIEIAKSLRWSPRGAYEPARLLEGAGILERLAASQRARHYFAVASPRPVYFTAPEPPTGARANGAARIPARANDAVAAQRVAPLDASGAVGGMSQDAKCLPDTEQGKAVDPAAPLEECTEVDGSRFLGGNAVAAPMARAGDSPITNTTTKTVVGGTEDTAANAEAGQVAEVLRSIGVFENVIPGLAAKTALGLALAVKFEVEKKKTPGRLANWILNQDRPQSYVNSPARAKAEQELRKLAVAAGGDSSQSPASGPRADPSANPALERAAQAAEEALLIRTILKRTDLVAAARRQAIEAYADLPVVRDRILNMPNPERHGFIQNFVRDALAAEAADRLLELHTSTAPAA